MAATKLSERIRGQRLAAGLTLQQMGHLVGVDPNTVGRAERGEQEPSLRTVRRYAEIFGVALDDLAGSRDIGLNEDLRRQINAWSGIRRDASATYATLAESAAHHLVRAFFVEMKIEEERCENDEARLRADFQEKIDAIAERAQRASRAGEADATYEANALAERTCQDRSERIWEARAKPVQELPAARALFTKAQIEIIQSIARPEKSWGYGPETFRHWFDCLLGTLAAE